MPKFVKAEAGPYDSVIFYDSSGKRYVARSGSRNYRNNNPGNLVPGEVSKRNGQIGVAGKFAVFPDFEIGKRAMSDSLRTVYDGRSLEDMIERMFDRSMLGKKKSFAFEKTKRGRSPITTWKVSVG